MNDRSFRDFILALILGVIGVVALVLLIFVLDAPICNQYVEAHTSYTWGVCR